MTRNELKALVEKTAKEANTTEIEIISVMQSVAATKGEEKTIKELADVKWDYINLV